MRTTVVPGVFSWSIWQPDRGLDFNGFFIESAEGNVVVDPMAPPPEVLAALIERGVRTIVVTNRDHLRAAAAVAAGTGAEIVASASDAPLLDIAVARTVDAGDVVHGWHVLAFEGLKTAGEIALYDPARRTAIVGDAIWGTPAGALTLMPDAKLADPVRAALSLRSLRARPLDHLLLGDGACVFGIAGAALDAMFDARLDAPVERVNIDELAFRRFDGPPPFVGRFAELGRLLGAQRLGSAVAHLRRGDVLSPYHWHTGEEELFVVMRGTPVMRTPAGRLALRAGDVVSCRTGERGAHRLENDADEDAYVLIVANSDAGDVCFYPDSRKLLVERTDTLVRSAPQLTYFDGEA